ncbi:MAG: MFS transporter [Caulobacteraceae bacterium]|nr:MFS transporter [Caulobacteraceae bacterium]
MKIIKPSRLSNSQLAIFSSPVLVATALETPWRVYLPAFFSEQLGLGLAQVAALLMWIRLFDVLSDPAAGWASDRFATPIGSRRPWMLLSAPLIVLGTWQVFFAHSGIGAWTLAAWCMVMHLGYSLLIVPHGGWGLEIADHPQERTRIMGAKVWFAAAGAPLIILLPSIMERWTRAGRADQVHAMGYSLMLLAVLSVGLVVWRIPEVQIERRADAVERGAANPLRQFFTILKNPALLRILSLYGLMGLADASTSSVFLFFVDRTLNLGRVAGGLLLIQSLVALVAIPVWVTISHRIGRRRAMLAVLAWQALTAPIPLLLPAGSFAPLIAFLLVRGMCWGADYMLLRAMVADLSDADTARSGERRSGSYYALFNVSLKLVAGLGVGATLWGLSRLAGFDPRVTQTSEGASLAIRIAYCAPSFIAALLGLAIFLGEPGRVRQASQPAASAS